MLFRKAFTNSIGGSFSYQLQKAQLIFLLIYRFVGTYIWKSFDIYLVFKIILFFLGSNLIPLLNINLQILLFIAYTLYINDLLGYLCGFLACTGCFQSKLFAFSCYCTYTSFIVPFGLSDYCTYMWFVDLPIVTNLIALLYKF